MNRFKRVSWILFIITTTIIVGTTIKILINDERIIMAQQVGGPGVTPIDPENVTNQTLQSYPTEDKNMSTGLEENEEIKFNSLFIV
jgi:hypothetical protein